MRKILVLGGVLCLLAACSGPQEPVFKRMSNLRVTEMNLNQITLLADAMYYNPNVLGIKLKSTDIKVKVNEVDVGEIKQELSIKVEPQSDFTVPVEISFPPKKILDNDSGLFNSVLQAFANKSINVIYSGKITVDIAGVAFDVPVEYEEEVPLQKE